MPVDPSGRTSLKCRSSRETFATWRPVNSFARPGFGRVRLQLLVGGPPCTPFSKSGYWLEQKRHGLDPEASLLEHYVRVLDEARPRMFLLENVFALAYSNHNRAWLEFLLESFDRLGYHVNREVMLAADFGVPQRRQRLIIVGSLEGRPAFPAPTHTGPHERRVWERGELEMHTNRSRGDRRSREPR